MKTIKYLFSAFVVIVAVACQAVSIDVTPIDEESGSKLTTITCAFPSMTDQNGTKVSLASDGTTGWQAGDKIVIYGKRNHADSDDNPLADKVIHTLTAAEVADPSNAVFTVDLSGLTADPAGNHPFNAVYPADESDDYLPFYSPWGASGRARFIDTNKLLLAGWVDGGVMTLKNVCAAITFTVDGDFDKYYFSGYKGTEIVGYGQYLVEFNNTEDQTEAERYHRKDGEDWGCKNPLAEISGPVISDGTTLNYIYLPNEVNLPDGFTIILEKSGEKLKKISAKAELNLTHDHMINLGTLPPSKMKDYSVFSAAEKTAAYDLGGTATANCYIVSEAGDTNNDKMFKFKAVRGNSSISVGSVVSVEVLWETYNSDSTPTAKSIIQKIDYADSYVYFKTPPSLHAGNALIAAKDSGGNVLWSWLIWAPSTNINDIDSGFAATGKAIMDRNLGALSVATTAAVPDMVTYGLYYQWGRRDPLLSSSMKSVGMALSTSTTAVTAETALANPTVFYYTSEDDWSTDNIPTLWNNSGKSIYDPCPAGYKVPVYNSELKLWKKTDTDWTFNTTNKYTKHNSYDSVFPMPGYLNSNSRSVSGAGARALIWAGDAYNTAKGYSAFIYHGQSSQYNRDQYYKRLGGSIRCVAE